MEATDPATDWTSARVVAGAWPGTRGLPLLEGEPRGRAGPGRRARACRKRPRDSEATSPSVVFKSTQNLPESLKCVFFLHHKVIIKLSFLLFA